MDNMTLDIVHCSPESTLVKSTNYINFVIIQGVNVGRRHVGVVVVDVVVAEEVGEEVREVVPMTVIVDMVDMVIVMVMVVGRGGEGAVSLHPSQCPYPTHHQALFQIFTGIFSVFSHPPLPFTW